MLRFNTSIFRVKLCDETLARVKPSILCTLYSCAGQKPETSVIDHQQDNVEIYVQCTCIYFSTFPYYFRTVSPSGPAGSVTSTASDMAKWMKFHLQSGQNMHGHQLVDEQWLEETYKSQTTNPFGENDLVRPTYPASDMTISYNMGWMSSSYRGYNNHVLFLCLMF